MDQQWINEKIQVAKVRYFKLTRVIMPRHYFLHGKVRYL